MYQSLPVCDVLGAVAKEQLRTTGKGGDIRQLLTVELTGCLGPYTARRQRSAALLLQCSCNLAEHPQEHSWRTRDLVPACQRLSWRNTVLRRGSSLHDNGCGTLCENPSTCNAQCVGFSIEWQAAW